LSHGAGAEATADVAAEATAEVAAGGHGGGFGGRTKLEQPVVNPCFFCFVLVWECSKLSNELIAMVLREGAMKCLELQLLNV
jgi:hypothetical protein